MATVSRTFAFATTAEGFTATAGSTSVTMSYDSATGNPAGALRTTTSTRNLALTASYWEWTGTWEALGVPAGATVQSVQLTSASTRCTGYTSGRSGTTIGPYELRDAAGTTVLGTLWAGRTVTAVDASWVATATQTAVTVPAGSSASGSTVRLRLADTIGTSNTTGATVTTYDDQVTVQVAYVFAVTGAVNLTGTGGLSGAGAPGGAEAAGAVADGALMASGAAAAAAPVGERLISTLDLIPTNGTAPTTTNSNITGMANNSTPVIFASTDIPPPHAGVTVTKFAMTVSTGALAYWDAAKWSATPVGTTYYGEVYLYLVSNTGAVGLIGMTTSSFSSMHSVRLAATRTLQIYNIGSAVATGTTVIPFGQWVRIEYRTFLNGTTGQTIARLFLNPESDTPSETITGTVGSTIGSGTAVITRAIIGNPGGGTSATHYFADARWSDTDWLGPLAAPPLAASGAADLAGEGTLTLGGGPAAAGTVPLSATGALTPAGVPAPAGAPSLTATGSLAPAGVPALPPVSVPLTATGSLSLAAVPRPAGAPALASTGALTLAVLPRAAGALNLTSTGGLVVSASGGGAGAVTLNAAGALALAALPAVAGTGGLTGQGTLTITPAGLTAAGVAALAAEGALNAPALAAAGGALDLSTTGTLAPTGLALGGPAATVKAIGPVAAVATGTSLTVPVPPEAAAGDYLVAVLYDQLSSSAVDWPMGATGFARIGPAFIPADAATRIAGLFGQQLTAAPPASYTFGTPGGTTAARLVGAIIALSGVDAVTPVDSSTPWAASNTTTTSISVPAGGTPGDLTLEFYETDYTSPNSYAITGYDGGLADVLDAPNPAGAENTAVSRTMVRVFAGVAPAGGVPAHTITTAGVSSHRAVYLVSLRGSTVTPPTTGTVALASTGTLAVSGARTGTPAPGYKSVAEMLAQPKFYCAHRGGSLDYPEMSLFAYEQSALNGYPALEVSLARTSDGVWFGLHDASLDRTSLGTGGGNGTQLVASSMTWAQVQAYSILGSMATNNPTQPARPYMRWEELIAEFYPSHMIFVDPKVVPASLLPELLDKMDALPGNPRDHFIGKSFGVAGGTGDTSGWNFLCHQRGYRTWGYFYEADSANYVTYGPRWDILGEDYTATQTAWDALRAATPGKPMMGHILPNAAAVTTANTRGANGYMVSGVNAIIPPPVVPQFPGTAPLTASGALAVGGAPRPAGTIGSTATGQLLVGAVGAGAGAVALNAAGALTAAALPAAQGTTGLTAQGALTISATRPTAAGQVNLTATGALSLPSTLPAVAGAVVLATVGALTLAPVAGARGVATLSATGSLLVLGGGGAGLINLAATGTLSTGVTALTVSAAVTFTGVGTFGLGALPSVGGGAALTGSGVLALAVVPTPAGLVTLTATGVLAVAGAPRPVGVVTLTATGALLTGVITPVGFTATGVLILAVAATPGQLVTLTAVGVLALSAQRPALLAGVALTGSGVLAVGAAKVTIAGGAVALTVVGALMMAALPIVPGLGLFTAAGHLTLTGVALGSTVHRPNYGRTVRGSAGVTSRPDLGRTTHT